MLRRKAWGKHLGRLAVDHGLLLYPPHLNWQVDERFQALVAEWGDVPGNADDVCQLHYALGRYVARRRLGGATAECGVRFGKTSFFFLSGARDADPSWETPHLLFDSFAGLPQPTGADAGGTRSDPWSAGGMAAPEAAARRQLGRFLKLCSFHTGWIPQTFEGLDEERFAFVHIDVDLYRSTLDAFRYFYPRTIPGGILLCDDYGWSSCPGATRALDEYLEDKPEPLLPLPMGSALIIRL